MISWIFDWEVLVLGDQIVLDLLFVEVGVVLTVVDEC